MRVLSMVVLAIGLGTVGAVADEVALRFEQLPGAVRASVQKHYPKARRLGFSRERENGRLLYEAELENDGRHLDASFDSLGTLKLEEMKIAWHEVPDAVRKSFSSSRHSAGTVERSERITEIGTKHPPHFELAVREGDARSELEFDSTGRLLHEERIGRGD